MAECRAAVVILVAEPGLKRSRSAFVQRMPISGTPT
jgi:hypothetical protein